MRVICLGDSLTYGFSLARDKVWTSICVAKTGADIINLAINGNTTGGMLAMLPKYMDELSPDAVFLIGGINDLIYGGDLAGAKANTGAMIHIVLSRCVLPIMGTAIPFCRPFQGSFSELVNFEDIAEKNKKFNSWLHLICGTFNVPVVDLASEFPKRCLLSERNLREFYLEDGMHPNEAGHGLIAEIIAEWLQRLITSRNKKER